MQWYEYGLHIHGRYIIPFLLSSLCKPHTELGFQTYSISICSKWGRKREGQENSAPLCTAPTPPVRNGWYFASNVSFCLKNKQKIRFLLVTPSPKNTVITFLKGNNVHYSLFVLGNQCSGASSKPLFHSGLIQTILIKNVTPQIWARNTLLGKLPGPMWNSRKWASIMYQTMQNTCTDYEHTSLKLLLY